MELYEALDTSLGLASSGAFSISGVDIEAGINLSSNRINAEYLDASHEVFVMRYTSMRKRYTLQTQPRPLKPEISSSFLRTDNQKTLQRDFFSECGDRYVDGDNCIHPGLYRTANNSLLMDKLSSDTPDFYETDISSRVAKQSVTGGVWNKKCISDVIELCLPVGCYENKPQSDNYKGYKYNEVSYKSPANSGGYRNTNADVYTNTSSVTRLQQPHRCLPLKLLECDLF